MNVVGILNFFFCLYCYFYIEWKPFPSSILKTKMIKFLEYSLIFYTKINQKLIQLIIKNVVYTYSHFPKY